MKGDKLLIMFVALFISFLFFVHTARAITNEELLQKIEELRNIVQQQQKEIEQLKKQLQKQKEVSKLPKGKVKEIKAEKGKKEVLVKASRKPRTFNIKGRVQVRFMTMENGDLSKVTAQKAFDSSKFDGFCIRRTRLRVFGNVTDRWSYHFQFSVDGDSNADSIDPSLPDYELLKDDVGLKLQDAEINYQIHPYLNIHLGQFKSRFSPSYLIRGPLLPLCERPLVVDKLALKREIGISIESSKGKHEWDGRAHGWKPYDKPIYYAIGIYNGNGFNKMRNDNDNFMYTAMLLVRPSKYLILGASYAYDKTGYDNETTVLGSAIKKNIGGQDYYVFEVKDHEVGKNLSIWDFNAALDVWRVHIQAEYVQRHGHNSPLAYGYGIQGQFDLLDNLQFTWRYDEFDPNTRVDNTFDSRWYTIGFNWFIYGQKIKWQANYTFRDEMHGEEIDNDVFISHLQVLF